MEVGERTAAIKRRIAGHAPRAITKTPSGDDKLEGELRSRSIKYLASKGRGR